MLSSGKRIEGIGIEKKHRIIVVSNLKQKAEFVSIITVKDDGSNSNPRKFYRDETIKDINITCFDGEGLISREYAEDLDRAYCGEHIHSSFQIRMPYVKGMLHEVDFKDFFRRHNVHYIKGVWG